MGGARAAPHLTVPAAQMGALHAHSTTAHSCTPIKLVCEPSGRSGAREGHVTLHGSPPGTGAALAEAEDQDTGDTEARPQGPAGTSPSLEGPQGGWGQPPGSLVGQTHRDGLLGLQGGLRRENTPRLKAPHLHLGPTPARPGTNMPWVPGPPQGLGRPPAVRTPETQARSPRGVAGTRVCRRNPAFSPLPWGAPKRQPLSPGLRAGVTPDRHPVS